MLRNREHGYSLVEVIVVLALIGIVSSVALSYLHARKANAGLLEQSLRAVEQTVAERRTAAIRLQSLSEATSLETFRQPPVEIDFNNPDSTRALVTDGRDLNDDGIDDNTGAALTIAQAPTSTQPNAEGSWRYAYAGLPLVLPAGWSIARNSEELRGVPLIGAAGVGEIVTRIAFAPNGTARAFNGTQWISIPATASASTNQPCWAIYLIPNSTTPDVAGAVAIHPTGALELWRWDSSGWRGFQNRSSD